MRMIRLHSTNLPSENPTSDSHRRSVLFIAGVFAFYFILVFSTHSSFTSFITLTDPKNTALSSASASVSASIPASSSLSHPNPPSSSTETATPSPELVPQQPSASKLSHATGSPSSSSPTSSSSSFSSRPFELAPSTVSLSTTNLSGSLSHSSMPSLAKNRKIYLLYRSFYGNLNNMILIHRMVCHLILKSRFRESIVLVTGETPYGEYILEDYFGGVPQGITSMRSRDFFALPDAKQLVESSFLYVDSRADYDRSLRDFYEAKAYYLKKLDIAPPKPKIMSTQFAGVPAGAACGYLLSMFRRVFDWCLKDEPVTPCRLIALPALFSNHDNCTRLDPDMMKTTALLNPNTFYESVLQKGIQKLQAHSPIASIHLRFLPMGMGKYWYGKGGQYFEGSLPNNMDPKIFVTEAIDTFFCLSQNYGWKAPRGVYLLGWPSVVQLFTPLFEEQGLKVFSFDHIYLTDPDLEFFLKDKKVQWFRAFLDEFTAARTEYFTSMWRSTLTLFIGDVRLMDKSYLHQYFPDMLPNYGSVYRGSFDFPLCRQLNPKQIPHVLDHNLRAPPADKLAKQVPKIPKIRTFTNL